jgi:ribose transport system substrate-binding protein
MRGLKGLLCAAAVAALMVAAGYQNSAQAMAKCMTGERKPPYTIGWANIYSVPTWMKQTQGTLEETINELKAKGLVDKLVVTDAEGNANTQIAQIQSMIDADVDGIVLIAGSATALDRVVADACKKGIAVINFDSLVTTDELTAKVNTDSKAWG